MAIRFKRSAPDGATEILTIVHVDGAEAGDFAIEIKSGPELGADFVGIYDLDGAELQTGARASWEAVDETDVPAEVVTAIEEDWAHALYVVERLPSVDEGTAS